METGEHVRRLSTVHGIIVKRNQHEGDAVGFLPMSREVNAKWTCDDNFGMRKLQPRREAGRDPGGEAEATRASCSWRSDVRADGCRLARELLCRPS